VALPWILGDPGRIASAGAALYLALAVAGLHVAVALGGMPSLGQGLFVGLGAFGAAEVQVHAGWGIGPAVVVGTLAAAAVGVLVGAGVVRLQPPFVAAWTWVASWVFVLGLRAFPGVSGGAQGLVLPPPKLRFPFVGGTATLTPTASYEVALVLVVVALLCLAAVARSPLGARLAAVRQGRPLASGLGIDVPRARMVAFATSAGIGGLAGALAVQMVGVADAGAYGPLFSVELFIAVLIGARAGALGPLIGAAVLWLLPGAARGLGSTAGLGPERLEPIIAAGLLALAVALGGGALRLPRPARRVGPAAPAPTPSGPAPRHATTPPATQTHRSAGDGTLRAESVTKRFGGLVALDGVSLSLRGGRIEGLVGPNGSGKSTLLAILAGALRPDEGGVLLGETDLSATGVVARVRLGVVRTPQATAVFEGATVLEQVAAGVSLRTRFEGPVRTSLATPRHRREAREVRARALEVLDAFGLADRADDPPDRISTAEQRLLMIATAWATRPSVLLLDEPAAGMSSPEIGRLRAFLDRAAAAGVALLIVEHHVPLILSVAERITVLDAGRVIARGTAAEIRADPEVRRAYLGRRADPDGPPVSRA
jgi:branched-chain amino acid transport system permease protein